MRCDRNRTISVAMRMILHLIGTLVVDLLFKPRHQLEVENLFLRHQLNIAVRHAPHRIRLSAIDRACWYDDPAHAKPAQLDPDRSTRDHLAMAPGRIPSVLVLEICGRPGRPKIELDLCELIRRMSKENPLWGAPRLHGELLKLGFELAKSTVSKYMIKRRGPPSQGWRTFLRNHAEAIAAIDLCVVPTLSFERLFAFLVLGHGRRRLLWFAVTRQPTAEWLAQQIVEAFPWDTAPAYLVRDNDSAYGPLFTRRVRAMGIRDRPIAPRSPWQNPCVERLIGTIRRDCLDHMLIFGEQHLRRVLALYALYYNGTRTHPRIRQGCTARASYPMLRRHCGYSDLIRTAPPLRADLIFGRDRYPCGKRELSRASKSPKS